MRWIAGLALALLSLAGAAAPVSFGWGAGAGYPPGVTYELQANECSLAGISGTTATCDLAGAPGEPLHARVRAVAEGYDPSPWASMPPGTVIPSAGGFVPLFGTNLRATRKPESPGGY